MLLSLPPQVLIILAFCLIFALTFHEFGHAYTAHLCGDDTAKAAGRMTLNPLVHLDLFGSLMVLIVGFGYARPVPVNPNNYRVRNADFYIASAGPLMNLLLGIIAAFLYGVLAQNSITILAGVPLLFLLKLFIIINFNLFLFNLIPLGPLDGNSVFPHFLPANLRIRFQHWNFRYGSYALIGLVLLSILLPGFSAFSWITSISMSMTNGLL
ncbi:MAG: site-2 protease family protein [SAR324 cluster bacterium]|jgi:Zn-dependent protease|nr:site-2 protease family protein [SAR324 cluster bacterium]MCS5553494.1 site-2 protease family protein [SAR324 cluster bacterium]|tara:strand:- start:652 stop:1284 length:633 start_codon:yes stop_codon:yes gene_type:complete